MRTRAPEVYRSRTNTTFAVLAWVLCVAGGILIVGSAPDDALHLWGLIPLALVAVLAFELFWQPRIFVDDDAVTLQDIFRTVHIPWTAVVDIDTRWALTIVTPGRRYRSSAAPAPGMMSRPLTGRQSSSPRVDSDGYVRRSDALGTESGDAAHIVRARWSALVEAERVPLGRAQTARPDVRVHYAVVVAVALLTAASLATLPLL